ncbi:MAG: glycosyltransferase family 2 protein [Abyssibacter sp.]|uniref:glycosyltransferase family 2 protein n=1 Tax=Abyssibacter sp. TaxID=2320200 RepID=UPI003219FA8A
MSRTGATAPIVSVIMAARNAESSIDAAVASVRDQTLGDWELIVVDDDSTDGTPMAVRRHAEADKRICLLNMAIQSGPGAARNAALTAARGQWVAVLDADDRYHPERLARMVEAAEAAGADAYADNLYLDCAPGKEADSLLAFDPLYLDRLGQLTLPVFLESDRPRNGQSSLGYLKPIMRRAFLSQQGFRYNQSLLVCEDSHLYARILMTGTPIHCGGWGGYYYARSEGSITRDADNHLRNAAFALASNHDLLRLARRMGDPALITSLRRHGREITAVYQIDRLKRALRQRSLTELLAWTPGGLRNSPWIAKFACARLAAGRPDNPVGLPSMRRKGPTLSHDRRATDRV